MKRPNKKANERRRLKAVERLRVHYRQKIDKMIEEVNHEKDLMYRLTGTSYDGNGDK